VAAVSEFCIVVPGCVRESAFADGGGPEVVAFGEADGVACDVVPGTDLGTGGAADLAPEPEREF
jgi:hypothetical protein